jgi:protein-tyrosine phosphatase
MAEALLKAGLAGSGCAVSSAGTAALVGSEAAPYTRQTLTEHGYDVSRHRAQQATAAVLKSMDLIIAIDATHADWIVGNFPALRGRVHKLGKWRGNIDIADPYGHPKEAYEDAFQLIEACVGDWLPHLAGKRAGQAQPRTPGS